MQGRHEYQPELFSSVAIENLIPKNHLLRQIDRVLDLEFLQKLTAPLYSPGQGRPSVDPIIFVRMVFLQALYNIDSDRQLCEEVGYNLAYRWFCRLSLSDSVPDHSSLTKIRDRFGEKTYQEIFSQVLEQCKKAGLVKGEQVMMDGSMMKANASIYAMVERKSETTIAGNLTEKPEEKIQNDDSDAGTPPPPAPATPKPYLGQIHSKDGLSNNDLRKRHILGKKISNKTHVSKSDPDSTLAGKDHETKSLSYKTHHSIDASSRVIVDCHVTTGSVSEIKMIQSRVEHIEEKLGLKIGELIADRGYGSGESLEFLHGRGIQTNIPLWSSNSGSTFFRELGAGFTVIPDGKIVHCPEGHRMKYSGRDKQREIFTVPREVCKACPRFTSCLNEYQQAERGKRFCLVEHFEIFLKVAAQSKDREFKKKLWQRMWKMEGIFAEAKSHHGLRRARYRGRWKVQSQVYVISAVQNLKRLAFAVSFVFISLKWELRKNIFRRLFFPETRKFAY